MKLCLKLCSSVFMVTYVKPIGPKVALLTVFTCNVFFIIFTLSEILVKSWYEMHEQVASVLNRAIIGSQF